MEYMKNAVRSIDRFLPTADRLLIDDGSNCTNAKETLREIAARPGWKVKQTTRPTFPCSGLYRNMHLGLRYALSAGYDYIFFLEDDEQVVWRDSDFLTESAQTFESETECIGIQPLFFRRIRIMPRQLEFNRSANAYRTTRGFTTTGIFDLKKIRQLNFRIFYKKPDSCLKYNSALLMNSGYRLYAKKNPCVAVVPWCHKESAKADQHALRMRDRKEFILDPLTDNQIHYLITRSPENLPAQEYFKLGKSNTFGPIWHRAFSTLDAFYARCEEVLEAENTEGQSPITVPIIESSVESSLPKLDLHIKSLNDLGKTPQSKFRQATFFRRVREYISAKRQMAKAHYGISVVGIVSYVRLTRRLRREQRALPFHCSPMS